MAFDVWMVVPEWKRGFTTHEDRSDATLEAAADHIDHICQLLGTSQHTGIGTDLDGGFGNEQAPKGMDTIADLGKFRQVLESRGYSSTALEGIFSDNFLRFLETSWG